MDEETGMHEHLPAVWLLNTKKSRAVSREDPLNCFVDTLESESHPRILLISSLFAPEVGGVCTVAESLANELAEHIVVIASKKPALPQRLHDWKTYDSRFPFQVHRVESFGLELPKWLPPKLRGPLQFALNVVWTRPRAVRSVRALLATHPADVICINTLHCYWLADALKRLDPTLKSVFYIHGEEISPGNTVRRLERLQHKAMKKADAIVAVSSFTAGLLQRIGIADNKVFVINNGVDTDRFTPGPKDATIVEKFGLKDKRILLCLARLDKRKGQDMLIRAMPQILEQVPNATLLLVGAGEDVDRLLQLRRELDLESRVIFAGLVADAERVAYYRTADVYVMPNRTLESGDTEGFGLVFLEAGACGKPVIGGKAGGVPDAIVNGETGYLVDGNSLTEVAAVCTRLLLDPDDSARLGARGRAHSLRNTWTIQAKRFLALCINAVEGRGS